MYFKKFQQKTVFFLNILPNKFDFSLLNYFIDLEDLNFLKKETYFVKKSFKIMEWNDFIFTDA